MIYNSTTYIYTYTAADGTVIHFDKNRATNSPYYSNAGRATDVVRPSGVKLVYSYSPMDYCRTWKPGGAGNICMSTGTIYILDTIRNSYGYKISLQHPDTGYIYDSTAPDIQPDFAMVSKVTGATMTNLAVASGASTPTETFDDTPIGGVPYFSVTDPMGRVTKYRMTSGLLSGVTRPASTSEDITIGYTSGLVFSIATPAGTTSYARSDVSGVRTVTVTDPLSHATVYTFDIASQRMTGVTDSNGRATSAVYDTSGRVTRVTRPEGNYSQTTYDARGNVTEQREVAKSGSGLADVVVTAGYDTTCTNTITCNQPNWTKDAKGNQTDYAYEATHGDLLSQTSPAPTTGAVRPQTRFSYSTLQAYFKNSSGSIVASGEPVTRLTGTSACQTASSCTGTADEVKASVSYGPQTTGVGNNLLAVSASQGSGDGVLTATTAYTYDDVGNQLTVDGPLPGTADTTRYRYDAARTQIGAVSPDPDGAGSLKNRAKRTTIDVRGLVTRVENGTVNSQSDVDWAAFTPADAVDVTYDSALRPATARLSSGGTNYALTQASYDAAGRVDCVAVRMNTSLFGSLPTSACTLGTSGSFGPDQITKTLYDNAGQPTQRLVAYGTSDQAADATLTYSNNGKVTSLLDGMSNKTTYVYDGLDRLSQTQYPSSTQGAGTSNPTNYEQLGYDANSNVTSVRRRDGRTFSLAYDALNRLASKIVPDGCAPSQQGVCPAASATRDPYYTYDLLGRLLGARLDSASGADAVTMAYDALGRMTSSTTSMGGFSKTLGSQYDVAGNRTRLTHPDGTYFSFGYDPLNRLGTGSWTNGGGTTAFLTNSYDSLGRKTGIARGASSSTSYGFDAISRVSSIAQGFTGAIGNVTSTLGYTPSSQIASETRDNDAFAWGGGVNVNRGYTANGLNQYTLSGAAVPTYDTNGNLIGDGTSSYGYDAENRLISKSNGASLSYDPLGRLWQVTSSSTNNRFLYDGDQLALEYDVSGNVARRYAFGDQIDQPILEDSGGALACGTTTRFLNGDIRGSVIAQADCAGNRTAINAYDEYGIPAATNVGRFQYTGQAWLPELGMYYYKARVYSPTLGRFMQTDPIGVNGGINIYAYAGGDPVNLSDPSGLIPSICGTPSCSTIVVTGPSRGGPGIVVESPSRGRSIDISDRNAHDPRATTPRDGNGGGAEQSPQKTKPGTSVNCAIVAGSVAGSAAAVTVEGVSAVAAIAGGARIGAIVGELGGPLGLGAGIVVGGAVGYAVYRYDLGNTTPVNQLKGCPK